MKKYFTLFISLTASVVFAQNDREITYGLFAGGIYSSMSNLPDVIVPKGIYQGYSLEEKAKFGGTAGIFINWKYPYNNVSLLTEVSYSGQGTDLNYEDIEGLKYKMEFNYQYINLGAQFKYYPIEGLYVGIGPYVAFNFAGDNIKYRSNAQEVFADSGTYFESDANVEKVLKESLTGRNFFYGQFSVGYEFRNKLSVGARYTLGLTDALTTEENGHRYSENQNKVNSISLVIGYSFYFDDLGNF
ncbi:outer membrane beta-barrel protein [Flavobacterium adhaerens]|uniref:outer membrane beta-barrel protein n=1 Tax=Flavobacterium adhaerens TaxID=3149043 RepID=UPI0032B3EF8B